MEKENKAADKSKVKKQVPLRMSKSYTMRSPSGRRTISDP